MMKGIVTIILIVCAVLTLTACGLKKENDSVIKLEFYQQKPEATEIVAQIIKNFEATHKGIEITQISLPEEETGAVLHNRIANGDIPDIYSDWFSEDFYVKVESGSAKDLSDWDLLDYVSDNALAQTNYKGKHYMIPISMNATGVFHNVDLFDELGIEIPQTLDEFWEVCEYLEANGHTAILSSDKETWTMGHWGLSLMGMYLTDYRNDFKKLYAGTISGSEVAGISDYADIFLNRKAYSQADTVGTSLDSCISEFVNGNGAMLMNGTWEIPVIEAAGPDFNYGIFPFPAENAEDTAAMTGVDFAIAVSPNLSEEKEAAVHEFLEYMLQYGANYYAEKDGSPSCVKSVTYVNQRYPEILQLIADGKCFPWPDLECWGTDTYSEYAITLQNLVISEDKEAFYEEFAHAFLITEPSTYSLE